MDTPPEPKPAEAHPRTAFTTVCRRTIHNNPVYYPQAEYQGRIIYFCTEFCLDAFKADPDRFYAAHRKKKS